ncbi:MAG: hypothetical protein Q8P45_00685 [Candidatus Harrisonbacteria bacterium]|nr:hypothetical protein [Candidatus Harrisonbacteria bacterium]
MKKELIIPILVLVALVGWFAFRAPSGSGAPEAVTASEHQMPSSITLPIRWADLGQRMVTLGVIDMEKIEALYERRGGLSEEERALLEQPNEKELVMTEENSNYLLNLLWAFGLANQSSVLENGPMRSDPQRTGNMASTGGWILSVGEPMNHYSAHAMVELNDDQQALVERVAKGIFRPCCGNSTYFPDCNHGMAMLGLLQLMAKEGVSEKEMYEVALGVNTLWFGGTYQAIAEYLALQGRSWESTDASEILSAQYSSGQGYQRVVQALEAKGGYKNGGGCGV